MLASSLALLSASLAGFDSGGASCHARSSLALLSTPLADFDSGGASCHARQQPGVVISATWLALPGGNIALLSTPLVGFDFRSASCHWRAQRPGPPRRKYSVVINAVGGLRFRERELPRSPAAWRCYQRHWRAQRPSLAAAWCFPVYGLALTTCSINHCRAGSCTCSGCCISVISQLGISSGPSTVRTGNQ